MKGGTVTPGGRVSFIRGNALTLPLADQSVALICSSPPYWALRDYRSGDGSLDGQLGSEPTPHHFLANLWRVMDECWRVLRDDGSAWINLGDKMAQAPGQYPMGHASGSLRISTAADQADQRAARKRSRSGATGGLRPKSRMELPHRFALACQWPAYRRFEEEQAGLPPTVAAPQWILRMDVVWAKPNGMPESVTDRCRISHEYWLHLVKSERYFAAIDEVRDEHSETAHGWKTEKPSLSHAASGTLNTGLRTTERNPLGKVPGSVWEVATEPLIVPPRVGRRPFRGVPVGVSSADCVGLVAVGCV